MDVCVGVRNVKRIIYGLRIFLCIMRKFIDLRIHLISSFTHSLKFDCDPLNVS